jgi:cysteine desulfurase
VSFVIYLDHAATTPPYPEVIETMKDVLETYYGNPSSLHHIGVQSDKVLKQSRELAAKFLEVKAGDIIFTSGATESNNLAIKGIAFQHAKRGKHIITSSIEHPAVLDVCLQLEQLGYRITILPVQIDGTVKAEDVEAAIAEDTILVSIMYVNNETGAIQPIGEIGKILQKYPKVFFHVDAVQGYGKLPVQPEHWGVDLLSLSAHKFHGPKGTGLLYLRKGIQLFPLMVGGGQERGVRSGTENLAGIVGMVKAMRISLDKLHKKSNHLYELREILWNRLKDLPGLTINSAQNGAPHIFNFSLPGIKSEIVLRSLEEKSFCISTKSACSSKLDQPSKVLTAMNVGEERANSSLRVSISYGNTKEEMEVFVSVMHQIVPELRSLLQVK